MLNNGIMIMKIPMMIMIILVIMIIYNNNDNNYNNNNDNNDNGNKKYSDNVNNENKDDMCDDIMVIHVSQSLPWYACTTATHKATPMKATNERRHHIALSHTSITGPQMPLPGCYLPVPCWWWCVQLPVSQSGYEPTIQDSGKVILLFL